MYKFFENINTLDELKKAYRRLAKRHHCLTGRLESSQSVKFLPDVWLGAPLQLQSPTHRTFPPILRP